MAHVLAHVKPLIKCRADFQIMIFKDGFQRMYAGDWIRHNGRRWLGCCAHHDTGCMTADFVQQRVWGLK